MLAAVAGARAEVLRVIGLGCMRLSTLPDRDDVNAVAVIHAALDAGARVLDTADAYCLSQEEAGHNERLIARALATWAGERSAVTVATKGGLTRPGGEWVPDGRASHLRAACEASLRALETDRIDLYQLHVVDPRVPLRTSVRALAALQREGLIARIGLCNVNVTQIEVARAIADISAVQVSMSVLDDENVRNGVRDYCAAHGIQLLAYRPLGGAKAGRLLRDERLRVSADRLGVAPADIALAWLMHHGAVPLPGATRTSTASGLRRALGVALSADDVALLGGAGALPPTVQPARMGSVVLLMGMPGAGKSSIAAQLVEEGYSRLNRDESGGTLTALADRLDEGLTTGAHQWVLDNTYATRASRNRVIEAAARHGIGVRCVWLRTDIADAQINAVTRMIDVHGSLPSPEEISAHGRTDPRYLLPSAQFRYERQLEPPTIEEGFSALETVPFTRRARPGAHTALLFDADRVDRTTLKPYRGMLLCGIVWRPQVAEGKTSHEAVRSSLEDMRVALELDVAISYCPHAAGPPLCWCRKPMPGLALQLAHDHDIDLSSSVLLAESQADRTMARRLGLRCVERA
jgi:aryl-alcohol dehydrogenase-like predicted oxidoreductase